MRSVELESFSMPNKSCITLDLFGCPTLFTTAAVFVLPAAFESWFLPLPASASEDEEPAIFPELAAVMA